MLVAGLFILLLGAVESAYQCKDGRWCPQICPKMTKRACGSDGKIYDHECEITCAAFCQKKIIVKQPMQYCQAVCDKSDCICSRLLDPVCGPDGNIYSNYCLLTCAARCWSRNGGVSKMPMEFCKSSEGNKSSTSVCDETNCKLSCLGDGSHQVCGSDGKIYFSRCHLKCAAWCRPVKEQPMKFCLSLVTSENRPTCDENNCKCGITKKPVCGTDGKIYDNICLLKCAAQCRSVKKQKMKFCKSMLSSESNPECDETKCNCDTKVKRVCGSDGKIYQNYCFLRCAARCRPVRARYMKYCLSSMQTGSSQECEQTNCKCDMRVNLVCGSDGKIYQNICLLRCAARCRPVRLQNMKFCLRPLTASGSCDEKNCNCGRILLPVCGSDGKVYNNLCLLACAARCRTLTTKPMEFCQSKTSVGDKCDEGDCICTREFNQVCGSDGKIYDNPCMLTCAARCRPVTEKPMSFCDKNERSRRWRNRYW